MSEFQEKLRGEGMKETTLARNCRHIKAALRWGEKMGIVARAPQIEIPRKAKGSQAKSRGVTGEEFERMLAAVPAIRPKDAQEWQRFLTGVWHSGLRLSEAVGLTWHSGLFCLDVSGRLPSFVIEPEGQKSDKPEVAPVTPDFVAWLRTTYPDARERDGRVFQLLNLRTGRPMEPHRVGEIVEKIGRKAKIKVGMATKRDKKTGKVVEIPVFAGCHSLRRGFGSKWARRVSPSILKRLMRHSSIATTEGYYVTLNADEVTRELCAEFGQKVAAGNISGNKAPQTSPIADAPQRT
jgi:integrase